MSFVVNNRTYDPPDRPLVIICLDGSADEYFDAALDRGLMPHLQDIASGGYRGLARGALPSFTNVNNAAIVTGVPPAVTGISGNYFLDPETGQEVMMNDASYLRCPTILSAAARSGRHVGMVTAKDKLRGILSSDLDGIAISVEKAAEIDLTIHGFTTAEDLVGEPHPDIYSADASLYVLKTGVALLAHDLADFLYLSTTDYIQHSFAHDEPGALAFYEQIDLQLGKLRAIGADIAITADHGMNAKQRSDGSPNVIYLESELVAKFGDGINVLLPITDPYVVHHGALGSFATIHLPPEQDADTVGSFIARLEGITEVHHRDRAIQLLELPGDRIGELVALSARDVVIGKTPEHHDLSVLEGTLRSHGGRYEEMVPMILSSPLSEAYTQKARADLRNFDIFDVVCNGREGGRDDG
jgi:phosphonoacetate hydrolase